jgi:outer membrane lipoprotein-sorting protein
MQVKRLVVGVAGVLALLSLCASAWAQADKTNPKSAAEPVVKQLEAFRRGDFDTAFTFASGMIQAQFDRQAFETMVRGGYPVIARSTFAAVT